MHTHRKLLNVSLKYLVYYIAKQTYQDSGKIQALDDPATLNGGMMLNRGTSAPSE